MKHIEIKFSVFNLYIYFKLGSVDLMKCTFQSEVLYAFFFSFCAIFHRLVNVNVDVQYIDF